MGVSFKSQPRWKKIYLIWITRIRVVLILVGRDETVWMQKNPSFDLPWNHLESWGQSYKKLSCKRLN